MSDERTDERLIEAIEKVQNDDPKAVEEGVQTLRQLAEDGVPEAHYNLGFCYYQGRGVEEDNQQAYEHLQASFEGGDVEGLAGMGILQLRGHGVEKDVVEAKKKLIAALHQNSVRAREHLPAYTDSDENVVIEDQVDDETWLVHGYDDEKRFLFRTKISGFDEVDELREFARYVIGHELIEDIVLGAEPVGWADFEGHTVEVLDFDRVR